jgi:hypothetical protein
MAVGWNIAERPFVTAPGGGAAWPVNHPMAKMGIIHLKNGFLLVFEIEDRNGCTIGGQCFILLTLLGVFHRL